MRQISRATPDRVEAAISDAANFGITLDYSAGGAKALARLISALEQEARIALDLDDGARVEDAIAPMLDVHALGTYYGELFVRHAGAVWGAAQGEDGLEPAVTRGGATLLPLDTVRRRVYDGAGVDLDKIFERETAEMASRCGEPAPGPVPLFISSWRTNATLALARCMYESRNFSEMPILADALQDAGCDDAEVLAHCRGPGPHVRSCWVVNLILERE